MSETRTEPGDDLSLGGDEELIARVRAGDGSAYGTLFARHVDAARRLAVAIAGRSEASHKILKTRPFQSTLAPASAG